MNGLVFDIQHFSLHDGPGIRTTVFLKGCSLHCFWCQNPEGISPKKELQFFESRCIQCGACVKACPNDVHYIKDGKHLLRRQDCRQCGKCVEVCPDGALVMAGKDQSTDEVVEEIARDKTFFEYSKGGITISGGEPLIQADFCYELMVKCQKQGIHTAIETALGVTWDKLKQVLPVTDLVMLDIKHIEDASHKDATGIAISPILENVKKLDNEDKPIIVRIPIIPGFNDSEEVIGKITDFIKDLKNLKYVELLPFHRLGENKYISLGETPVTQALQAPGKDKMKSLRAVASAAGLKVKS